jgi:hypothetical protein
VPVMATYERGQGVSVSEVGLGDKLGWGFQFRKCGRGR